MSIAEAKGVVELDRWTPLPGGLYALIEPTSNIRRFHIRITSERPIQATNRVRHRKVRRNRIDISGS